ncbi:MAG: hypothetical protein AAGF47_01370 [Planctomycetota bacterium]
MQPVMQPDTTPITANAIENLTAEPNFLVPILIGLAIAVAVQLLLTHLAAAVGLAAAGDLSETDEDDDGVPYNRYDVTSASSSSTPTFYERVQKLNHALGAWGLISATIALFVGAWLAAETSLTIDPTSGVVIGLAIWAVFYCAAMYLETTLIGSLVRRGVSAVGYAASGVGSVFSRSSKKTAAVQARAIAGAVRDEILEDKRIKNLGSDLRSVIDAVEQNTDPANLRSELETLIDRTEVDFDAGEDSEMVASMQTRRMPRGHKIKKAGGAVREAVSVAAEEYDSDRRPADSVARGAMRIGGASDEDADRRIEEFEDFLRSADESVLDPDAIKDELETLFQDPASGWAALKDRFASADRSTFEGLLTARGMDEDRAHSIVDRVASFADRFRSDDESDMSGAMSEGGDSGRTMSEHASARARRFAEKVDDPRLDGEAIEREVELLFDDPKAGADAIINRLKTLDRESIKAIIASRPGRDEEEAEELVGRVERARDRVTERAQQMKLKVAEKTEQAKQAALDTAEGTRKVASTAAWWAFGAATCSAASAAVAGYLAVMI